MLERLDAIHEQYLRDIVEKLNICPYARRSREQSRVLRPWLVGALDQINPAKVSERLLETRSERPDTEIILLSFLLPPKDPGHSLSAFEAWHRELRAAMSPQKVDRIWYSVVFHPQAGTQIDCAKDPAAFVQLLRRSPDPVIQCVCARTLETVRQKAQAQAKQKILRELEQKDPRVALLAQSCVMTDSSLSEDIARNNFDRLAQGPAYRELMQTLEDVHRARSAIEVPSALFPPAPPES